jgi:hypothetical protein
MDQPSFCYLGFQTDEDSNRTKDRINSRAKPEATLLGKDRIIQRVENPPES